MKVKILTAGALTHSLPLGRDILEGDQFTIRKALARLVEKYGDRMEEELMHQGNLREGLALLLNGRNVLSLPSRLETSLQEGDELLISLIVAGG